MGFKLPGHVRLAFASSTSKFVGYSGNNFSSWYMVYETQLMWLSIVVRT